MRSLKFAFALLIVFLAADSIVGQSRKTIILVRHAEKDVSANADPNAPGLSAAGRLRAERLAKLLAKYRVGAVYSTNYRRTRETVEPVAAKRHKSIQIYEESRPKDLIDTIMKSRTKRFLVVGHSNTVPALANMIEKKPLFASLEEEDHGTIWVFKLRADKLPLLKIINY
jgi:broad specificity phosphatase PhoE